MGNMDIYDSHRMPPKEALKPIGAGRLKGMTDINPMWRIKALTEQFGPCGIGWYYTTDKQWFEQCGQETVAFVNITLYVKINGEWSQPISGTGGSKLGTMEKNGLYVSDEALKMATTDAISVACKQLGFAADIYWQNDRSKYTDATQSAQATNSRANVQTNNSGSVQTQENVDKDLIPHGEGMNEARFNKIMAEIERTGIGKDRILGTYNVKTLMDLTEEQYIAAMNIFARKPNKS